MSNKGYAVLLVLAGMVCGILLVSLTSSLAEARPERNAAMNVSEAARPGSVQPIVARPDIRVHPVGMGGKNDETAYAYIVKDGKIYHCEGTMAREVRVR